MCVCAYAQEDTLERLLANPNLRAALPMCRGLVAHSHEAASHLQNQSLLRGIPVHVVQRPTGISAAQARRSHADVTDVSPSARKVGIAQRTHAQPPEVCAGPR